MKKSLFLSLLLIGCITLAGCQKSNWEPEVSESKYPVAEQVCVDNGWKVTVDEEGEDICLLGERSIYLADMEENPEAKISLSLKELDNLIETHFPTYYTSYEYDMSNDLFTDKGKHIYDETELGSLTPEYSNIIKRELISSGIEDWMIYTNIKAKLDDKREIDILYVVNPESLNFTAASIKDGDITTNYQFDYNDIELTDEESDKIEDNSQFNYNNIESLTSEELDEIAETNFPKGYTYSTFHMDENLIGDEGEVIYPEDFSHTLLIPDHATMASREVLSSWIEDGMIYTLTKVTLQDDTEIQILYINDPVTLNFVAASVENGNITTNYQFIY